MLFNIVSVLFGILCIYFTFLRIIYILLQTIIVGLENFDDISQDIMIVTVVDLIGHFGLFRVVNIIDRSFFISTEVISIQGSPLYILLGVVHVYPCQLAETVLSTEDINIICQLVELTSLISYMPILSIFSLNIP